MSNQEVIKELKHLEAVFSDLESFNQPLAEHYDDGFYDGKVAAYARALEHVQRRIKSLQGG